MNSSEGHTTYCHIYVIMDSPSSFEQFPPGLGAGGWDVGVWGCCVDWLRAVNRRSMENCGLWRSWLPGTCGCGSGYVNNGDAGNPAAAYDKLYGIGASPISRPILKGKLLSNILRSMGTLPPVVLLAVSGLKYDNMIVGCDFRSLLCERR